MKEVFVLRAINVLSMCDGMSGGNTQKKVFDNGRYRKLTSNEYRKLQTIPDWYKFDLADNHVYNMCSDGWIIEVIKHLLKNFKVEENYKFNWD